MSKLVAFSLAASVVLAACQQPPVKEVRLEPGSVRGEQRVAANPCNFRLKDVIDARDHGVDAGGLDLNHLKLDDASALVRSELLKSGLLPPDARQGRDVEVSLRRVYLSQNRLTKVPVVVYSVKAEGVPDFLVRAQPANMNWGGSQDAALASFSRAVHLANEQLMDSLNKACKV